MDDRDLQKQIDQLRADVDKLKQEMTESKTDRHFIKNLISVVANVLAMLSGHLDTASRTIRDLLKGDDHHDNRGTR